MVDGPIADLASRIGVRVGEHDVGDVVVLVVSALAAGLALVALQERHRFRPTDPTVGDDVRERPYPSPARALLTAPGTEVAEGAAARAANLRAAARASVLVLPVLARPSARPRWTELQDAVDSWIWHESWLRTVQPQPTTLPVDGLVIGTDFVVPRGRGRVVKIPEGEPLSVVPVSEGVILARPAARGTAGLVARAARDARVIAAEARRRPQSGVLLAHALVGFPLAVGLPIIAYATAAPVEVLWAACLPLATGILSTVLRWSALVDLDRSTTMRMPVGSGLRVVLTGPIHGLLMCAGGWRSLSGTDPIPLRRTVELGEAAA
jgi:hypothetical protein